MITELKSIITLASTWVVVVKNDTEVCMYSILLSGFIEVKPALTPLSTRLSGARIFSKLDANHGYWQIPLDDESQQLTTFNSPFGRYCFKRMPFHIKSALEIFQKRMTQNFGDLEGVETEIDDILVWGKTEEEHHKRLKAVLQRCQDIHLTLNMHPKSPI